MIPKIKLWLDDKRIAPLGYQWVKDYDEAIAALQSIKTLGIESEFSVFQMDHDLEDRHYQAWLKEHLKHEHIPESQIAKYLEKQDVEISKKYAAEYRGRTGYDVINWMEEHNVWPEVVIVHSFNTYGSQRMHQVASRYTRSYIRRYTGKES